MELERWPNQDEMIAELYGGAWSNRESWAKRCRPAGCIVCTSGHPFGIIADLNHTWVTTDPEVAIFGYVCVISKVHAVEPFDLPDQGAAFWQEAMAVPQVVDRLYRPVKLNYQIHGNTLPHLHMHLLPRQPNDGFVGRPVDLKDFQHRYSDQDPRQAQISPRPHHPKSLRRLRHCGPRPSPYVPAGWHPIPVSGQAASQYSGPSASFLGA